MRVSVETTTRLGRKATVAVPSETFEAEVADRLKQRAATLKLPGFRPGRVPMKEVQRRFDGAVRAEAAQTIVQSSLPDVLAKEALDVVGLPQVELLNTDAGNDFEYAATFEVRPTFELRPLEALHIRRPVADIDETDIDETVELLREKQTKWVEVRRAVEKKDRVTVDYAVKVGGEKRSEGTDARFLAGGWFAVAELPEAVLGMAPGETRTFPATVPTREQEDDAEQPPSTDGPGSDAAGEQDAAPDAATADDAGTAERNADADGGDTEARPPGEEGEAGAEGEASEAGIGEVALKRVEEPHLPALDDAFFEQLGIEPGPDREARFRTQVKSRMGAELQEAVGRAIRRELSEVLGRAHKFDLPVVLVREEFASRLQRLGDTVKLDTLPEWFQQAMLLEASNAVRLDLLLGKVAEVADISLDQDRLKARVKELAANFEDEDEAERAFYGDRDQLQRIAAAVLEDQAIEHVLAQAQVVDVPCSYSEAIAGRGLPPLPEDEDDAEPAATAAEAEDAASDGADAAAAFAQAAGEAAGSSETQPDAAQAEAPPKGGLVGRLRRLVGRDKPVDSEQPVKEPSR